MYFVIYYTVERRIVAIYYHWDYYHIHIYLKDKILLLKIFLFSSVLSTKVSVFFVTLSNLLSLKSHKSVRLHPEKKTFFGGRYLSFFIFILVGFVDLMWSIFLLFFSFMITISRRVFFICTFCSSLYLNILNISSAHISLTWEREYWRIS